MPSMISMCDGGSLDREGVFNFNWVDPGDIIPEKGDLKRMSVAKKYAHAQVMQRLQGRKFATHSILMMTFSDKRDFKRLHTPSVEMNVRRGGNSESSAVRML